MTRARALAWLVLLGSLALAATADPPADPVPRSAGPYIVLAADFHVHSFPGDGALLPWDLAAEARRRGLNVIALTNHNSTWSWRLARWLGRDRTDVIVLPGAELTSAGYHMTTIGVEAPVAWPQPPAAAAAAVHAQGGVVIAAHPLAPRPSDWDDAGIDAVDGFEAANSNDTLADVAPFTARAVARRPSIAPIGASDFHYFAPIGVSRTFVFVTDRSPAGVLDAVKRGRTVACDAWGSSYGAAELQPVVSGECRRLAQDSLRAPRVEVTSTYSAWLALVILVTLGFRECR